MTLVLVAIMVAVALLIAFGWWRFYFFHRNPARILPNGLDPVCPADGRIMYIEDVELAADVPDAYHRRVQAAFDTHGRWTVAATYLGIFDVHVVRAPLAGTIHLRPIPPVDRNISMGGSFIYAALRRPLPVGKRGYLDKNEFLGVEISGSIRVLLVLMADWWIDQIVPLVEDGARVERGQVIGRILMGSQVDFWSRAGDLAFVAEVGGRVRAGSDVIATVTRDARLETF